MQRHEILEMMATRQQSLEEIMSGMPRYYTSTRKVGSTGERALRVVAVQPGERRDARRHAVLVGKRVALSHAHRQAGCGQSTKHVGTLAAVGCALQ